MYFPFRRKNAVSDGMLGYKALSVDYSHYEYDMTMYGPIFGVTARFWLRTDPL